VTMRSAGEIRRFFSESAAVCVGRLIASEDH
jgi:hypothetical protein